MPRQPLWRRYARLLGPDPKSDVQDELRFHLDEKVDDLIAQGWDPRAARREAERQFGDLEGVKTMGEQLGREREHRIARREHWSEIGKDVRFGFRMLLKQPGFTLIAVLTLAFGIGATTAVFTLIQGVLLTPPPYRQPEQLMLVSSVRPDGQPLPSPRAWPAGQWQDWQKQAKSLEGVAAYAWNFAFLVRADGSESIEGMLVSPEYFQVTGLKPVLGRTFLPSEGGPNAPPVIILGHDLWQRAFNGDPNIIGKTVRVSRFTAPPTVIGVMAPGVRFLPSPRSAQEPSYDVNSQVDFWSPVLPDPTRQTQPRWDVVARLRSNATSGQAQGELSVLTAQEAQLERQYEGVAPKLTPIITDMNRDGERILMPLLGAAGLVFFIACGNAAALLLVRGLQRQQEYAVRSALGVGRVALFRQVGTESLLLALIGGTLGAALAVGLVNVFKYAGSHAVPRLEAVTTGWPLFFWGLGAAIVAALLAGLFPAMRASMFDPAQVLKSATAKSSAGRGERRLLRAVTVVQIALTLALLVGAGLLVRTMRNLANVQSGYDASRVLTMSVTAVQGDWADFHRRALLSVAAIPGIDGAAFAWGVPLTGNNWPAPVVIEGQPAPAKPADQTVFPVRAVTPNYFALLRQGLVNGRDFRDTDNKNAPGVAIINQAFSDRYFAGANPIGKKLWMQGREKPADEIIAVVKNSRTADLTKVAEPEIYTSLWQNSPFSKHLVVRSAADSLSVVSSIRSALHAVDPTVAIDNVKTLDQIRGDSLASRNFAMQLIAGFALIGSILTLIGIYGVLSLSVASRTRELAIRSAVGAQSSDIRNLVFSEGFRLIAGGIAAGIVVALLLSQLLQTFLFEVQTTDPATLAAAGVAFALVALLACWVPMRRAMKVEPIEALRCE